MTEKEHGSVAMGDSREVETREAFNKHKQTSLKAVASYYDFSAGYDAALSVCPAQDPVNGDLPQSPWPASGWAIDRIDELKTALEPFADVSDLIDVETEGFSDDDETNLMFSDYLLQSYTIADFRKARSAISALYAAPQPAHGTSATERDTPAPAQNLEGPQDISTAPAMTDVLVWWPIVKLDEDGDPTDEIVGGCWIISEDQGGYWIEPEVMNAIGDHMGDDHTYADKPSKWLPLPAPLFTAASEGSTDV